MVARLRTFPYAFTRMVERRPRPENGLSCAEGIWGMILVSRTSCGTVNEVGLLREIFDYGTNESSNRFVSSCCVMPLRHTSKPEICANLIA